VKSSLEDIQMKYDKATEEVALLQAEVASAENLRIENQRLKDELRDLKEEFTLLKENILPPHRPFPMEVELLLQVSRALVLLNQRV
jgi:hypothetical protein